eukprot:TRINITY_DN1511_c1_g2_i1.p1 TRINITY_DN1511_c1_g2~~TRINITY_DN1511_c1_g2_i1.p1  ORF type:complete len:458 (-),score=96.60 TRINITY_DN1511_c1_g2_i1:139-1512(-)
MGAFDDEEKEHLLSINNTYGDDEEVFNTFDDTEDDFELNDEKTGDKISMMINPNNKVFYEIFFVVYPLFCGYAILFSYQANLKSVIGISDADKHNSKIIGVGFSMLYVGNLIFRLGHNVVFAFTTSRNRVLIATSSMILSMCTILVIIFFTKDNTTFSIILVYVAYILGGLAIGSFEANVLSSITPLGKDTKFWAIVAMPCGINTVTIGGFLLLGWSKWLSNNIWVFYICVIILLIAGTICYFLRIYWLAQSVSTISLQKLVKDSCFDVENLKAWLWPLKFHCVALMIDMFCVSLLAPGLILYMYDTKDIDFSWFGCYINKFTFTAIYNSFFFIGDFTSRKIFYTNRLFNPFLFLILSGIGVAIALSHIVEIAPLCALLVAFANGSIYTQTNRKIDRDISEKFNLIAFSTWLFVGDIGSVIGSNSIQFIVDGIIYPIYGSPPTSSQDSSVAHSLLCL